MKTTHALSGLILALVLGVAGGAGAAYLWLAERDVWASAEKTSVRHADEVVEAHAEDAHEHGEAEDCDEHDDHAGHGEQTGGPVVRLTDGERDRLGITLATADHGTLKTSIRLPGEVVLNADRLAHIVPRAPGIVREVVKSVGDTVCAGEVMAWLESAELGEAKVDYLAKLAELGCCTMDLSRAREVHDNTMRLLETLDSSPTLEALRDMNGVAMGENRSELVSAYAELGFLEAAYQRERSLFERKIASEEDYQAAEAEYKKADALYAAKRDSIEFRTRRDRLEAERAQQVRQMQLKGAERHLHVLGLTAEDIKALEPLAQGQTRTSTEPAECNDPNCKDCANHAAKGDGAAGADDHEVEERLAWYPLRAPFDGTVIDRHLTLGERHDSDSDAFTVADLSSVWVDISVYQKDLPLVDEGRSVEIDAGVNGLRGQGVISYVAPVVDEKTRTTLARVILPNTTGEWQPGLFVTAHLSADVQDASVLIPKEAIQVVGDESVVFVPTGEGYRSQLVSVGRCSATHAEVLAGLSPGDRYVVVGAFALKAEAVTSGLGAHAGHGH